MILLILRIGLLAPHEGSAQLDQNTRQIKAVFAIDGGPPSTHLFRKRLPKGTGEGARDCLRRTEAGALCEEHPPPYDRRRTWRKSPGRTFQRVRLGKQPHAAFFLKSQRTTLEVAPISGPSPTP